jgi:hypothetical protein
VLDVPLLIRAARSRALRSGGTQVTLAGVLSSPWVWAFVPLWLIAVALFAAWLDGDL